MKREPFCFTRLYDDVGIGLTYFGRRILLNTRNIRTYSVITHGKLEPALCHLFEQFIKPGDRVIDVGANVGFLTLLACHLVGPKGQVYSFEPNPDVFELLTQSIDINAFKPRSQCFQNIVHDTEKSMQLTWNPERDGSGRVVSEKMPGLAEKSAEVAAVRLDDICGDQPVNLIKIDTEGAEPFVLYGAEKLIEDNPQLKIIMEWNPRHMMQRDADVEQCLDFIFKRFSSVQKINKVDSLTALDKKQLIDLPHCNILLSN
ncbi:FkbM family methyltransferase [Marinicella sp. W31]|uniref:FkbM family methyltransferase n=1 Tax=Marinicella sp. W31 TaxID=3023713 RepID=UPI003757948D